MVALAITERGQITLKRDLLRHLGVEAGERIELEKLPGGEVRLRAARSVGTIDGFLHALDGTVKSGRPLTVEDMNQIAQAGWAGELDPS